jgi:hypothetical protein
MKISKTKSVEPVIKAVIGYDSGLLFLEGVVEGEVFIIRNDGKVALFSKENKLKDLLTGSSRFAVLENEEITITFDNEY